MGWRPVRRVQTLRPVSVRKLFVSLEQLRQRPITMIMPTGETELQLWVADTKISQLVGILSTKPTGLGSASFSFVSKVGQTDTD